MIILAADTSGKQGSIALARVPDGANFLRHSADLVEILEVVPLAGGTFSAQLVPQIAALLTKHGFSVRDVNAFAVASGPGSFTGLRVGLAAIKALADVLQKPIATVSLLEAIACAAKYHGKIVAVLDAGRGDVYVGEYDVGDKTSMCRERLLSLDDLFSQPTEGVIVTPDSCIADVARNSGLTVELVPEPRSDTIAALGWEKIQAGEIVTPEELEANYIRRSDAEIFAKTNF
jgi:tRNA threonylcarbamoyladenosine biosynthesis protein TsaB